MEKNGDSASLEVPIWVENDLETDESGSLYITSFVYSGTDEYPAEIRVPFEDVVDGLIEFYTDELGSRPLYTIAHELARYAERLRASADHLEGQLDFSVFPDEYDEEHVDR